MVTREYKSVALLRDREGKLWLHDVATKKLLCFDKDLNRLKTFQGHGIPLCT